MKGFGNIKVSRAILGSTAIALVMATSPAWADEPTTQELLDRIEALEEVLGTIPALQQELQILRQQVSQSNQRADQAEAKAKQAEAKAAEATRTAQASQGRDGPLPDTKWHLAGYADSSAQFVSSDTGNDTFAFGHFNPVLHFQYKDLIMFQGELEFEVGDDGETEVALEYATLNFLVHDNATIVVGKFLSPVGQFIERLHPIWINKIGNAPAGFGHDGVQPISEVGVQVRGGISVGDRSMVNYVFMVGNGPRMGHEGGLELIGYGKDDNQNKSIGGRIGFLPVPYVEIGGSFMTAKVDGLEGEGALMPTTGKVKLWGADAAYTRGPWDFRFEYLKLVRDALNSAHMVGEDVVAMEQLIMKAWYLQLAYRLSEIATSPFLQKLEPVFRYGRFNISGNDELFEENAQKRWNFGLNYWLAPSVVTRIGYEHRKFLEDGHVEKVFMVQAAYGF